MNDYKRKRLSRASILAISGIMTLLLVPALVMAQGSQSVSIMLAEFKITPNKVSVSQGQSVQFTVKNAGTEEHNLVVELGGKGIEHKLFNTNLMPGETRTAEYTFPVAGDWEMYCPVDGHKDHGMKGDLEVVSAQSAGMPGTGAPSFTGIWLAGLVCLALVSGGLFIRRRKA